MTTFQHLGVQRPRAFIPFVPLGFPNSTTSIAIMRAMEAAGADMLELGFPFSDPVADGSVIQDANTEALRAGIDTEGCFKLLEALRETSSIPVGLLLYYNLVYQYGLKALCTRCSELKIGTILIADLPLEEASDIIHTLHSYAIKSVCIVSELTTDERLQRILGVTDGYLYVVSRPGVTGVRKSVSNVVPTLHRLHTRTALPLCVGFGVSSPAHVAELSRAGADGVICGSAIVRCINQHTGAENITHGLQSFIQEMRAALV